MYQRISPEEFWIVLTNIILACSAVVCLVTIFQMVYSEFLERHRKKNSLSNGRHYPTLIISGSGIVEKKSTARRTHRDDEEERLVISEKGVIERKEE